MSSKASPYIVFRVKYEVTANCEVACRFPYNFLCLFMLYYKGSVSSLDHTASNGKMISE
jgi:hypothetical protein